MDASRFAEIIVCCVLRGLVDCEVAGFFGGYSFDDFGLFVDLVVAVD